MRRIDLGWARRAVPAVAALALLAVASPLPATLFPVSNTNDSGSGSLRAAITSANANAGLDHVVFNAGVSGTIALANTITITDDLILAGPGPRSISVTGGNARRLFDVSAPTTISGIRFANGFTDQGGAIRYNASGLLSVTDCHFDQNLATGDGGAIAMLQGSLSVLRCTFTTDQAAGNGGVIAYGQGGGTPTASIVNSTFVNNFATNAGGAIRQAGTTAYTSTVTNCTFVVNNAGSGGGAIALNGGTMTLLNNLFTANGAGGNPGGHVLEGGGTFTSLGHNLFGNLGGTTFVPASSDRAGVVGSELATGVLIAFPFNNGGVTDTLPIQSTSIAIDAGGTTGAPVGDQRDFPRVGCAPDIGAFEVQTVTDSDADGVLNCLDLCASTPTCAAVDQTGCPIDGDDDGVFDGCDTCPDTVTGEVVDANGCATADEDADGVTNDADLCRGTPPCAVAAVDAAGCPTDADEDGVFDGCDLCPDDNDLTDADDDGFPDCLTTTTTTTSTTTTSSTTTTTLPELLAGRKLLLKDKAGKPQKRFVDFVLTAPTLSAGNASGDDPVQHGGTLRVVSTVAGFDTTYSLPASGWKYVGKPGAGKGYRFTGGQTIKSVIVKPGKLARAIGAGGGLGHTLETNPDPVAVVLALGAQSYCGRFGGTPQFTDGAKYVATNAPAPNRCGSASGAFVD